VAFSAVLIWMDTTVLNVALERLADPRAGLGASPKDLQWAVGAYSLTFATVLFAAGALGDRRGHRTILLTGIVIFGLASVWAAWSSSPLELIGARALMGAGGAMMMPSSMAIIAATFPPERRAAAIGAFSAFSGVGLACGPVLGGVLIDHFWWGSVFLANVPVVVLSLIGVVAVVPATRSPASRRLDIAGIALSSAALLLLAYGLIEGGQAGWGRSTVWGSLLAGLVVVGVFVVWELRRAEPSFDPRLFIDRGFAAGNVALGVMFLGITGQSFYSTFYLQGARGMSTWTAGLAALPAALGVTIGAPLGARGVRRFGFRPVAAPALGLTALTYGMNALYTLHTPLVVFEVLAAGAGLGVGATVAPTTAAVIARLPAARMGAGSAVNNTVRQVGSLLGVAALGTVIASVYRSGIAPSLAGLAPAERAAARPSAEATRRVAAATGRSDLVRAANDAFLHAMHVTALCACGVAVLGVAVLILGFRSSRAPAPAVAPAPLPAPAGPPTVPAPTGSGVAAGVSLAGAVDRPGSDSAEASRCPTSAPRS
jgi:EmrB/QacA subfamily drug resistance transporter